MSAAMTDGERATPMASENSRAMESRNTVAPGDLTMSPALEHPIPDAPAGTEEGSLDRLLHAREARFTGSLSLISLTLAYLDWILHLANAPGRRLELARAGVAPMDAALRAFPVDETAAWRSPL